MGFEFNPFTSNFDKTLDVEGTTNQVNIANTNGKKVFSTPQDIHTGASPTFADTTVTNFGLGAASLGLTVAHGASTGVVYGFALSINADPTKFDIGAGYGRIADVYTTPANPTISTVNYAGSTGNTVTNLATSDVTYLLLDSAGVIIQQTTFPTPVERRNYIFLGRLNHSNRTSILFADLFPDFLGSTLDQYYDLLDALAPFKVGGFQVSANGANMNFDRAGGTAFFRAINVASTPKNPHIATYSAQTVQPFRYMTQTNADVNGVNITNIDAANYDNGGVVTAVGGGTSRTTIQRIWLYKSGQVRVSYGQNVYTTFAEALDAVATDSHTPNPTVEQTAVLIGFIVIQRICTALNNTAQCRIITAGKFDAVGSAGGAGGLLTMQQTYANSTLPQIVLSSALGALTIRDNATPLAGNLFQIEDSTSVVHFGVGVNYIKIPVVTTAQRLALTPAAGMIVYDTTLGQLYLYNGSWGEVTKEKLQTDLTLTASDTIAVDLTHARQSFRVQGNSAAVTLSTTPFGSSAPLDGAEITLIGNDNTNTVKIPWSDVAKGVLGYDVTIAKGETVTYKYNSSLDRYLIQATSN